MSAEIERLKASLVRFAKERDWEQFHTPKNLAMAMSVEAAEVVEIFQWLTERQSRELGRARIADLADELADTYIYLLRIASHPFRHRLGGRRGEEAAQERAEVSREEGAGKREEVYRSLKILTGPGHPKKRNPPFGGSTS